MSVQTSYKFGTTRGCAGGIVDLAPYAIDTFLNEENNGVLEFGMGACVSTTTANIGKKVKLPSANSDVFEGVVINNRTTEYDLDGEIYLRKDKAVGVMRYGKVYVKLATNDAPAYGDAVYLVYTGANKGCFSKTSTNAIAINARFISGADNGVAAIELQQGNIVDATGSQYELPTASASVLGGVKVGSGLTMTDGVLSVTGG